MLSVIRNYPWFQVDWWNLSQNTSSDFIIHYILASCPSLFCPLVFSPWIRLGLFSWLRFSADTFTMLKQFQFGMDNLIVWCLFHAPPLNCRVSIKKFRTDSLRLVPYTTIDMNRIKLSSFWNRYFLFQYFIPFWNHSTALFLPGHSKWCKDNKSELRLGLV